MKRAFFLLLAGCSQQHVFIGDGPDSDAGEPELDAAPPARVDAETGPPLDAGVPDAALPERPDAAPLVASWRAFDVVGVTGIASLCHAGSCAEVSLEIEGGEPPYRVRWYDGSEGLSHRFCAEDATPDAAQQAALAVVHDARGQALTMPLGVSLTPCLSGNPAWALVGQWTFCMRPRPLPAPCPGMEGTWFDLGAELNHPANVIVTFRGAPAQASLELRTTGSLCQEATWTSWNYPSEPVLALSMTVIERYLRVSANGGAALPPWLELAELTVCSVE